MARDSFHCLECFGKAGVLLRPIMSVTTPGKIIGARALCDSCWAKLSGGN